MGDHGGGQPNVYRDVAKKLDDKYAPQGIHVYYCDEVYTKAQADFDKWLADNGYPTSSHAGIPDTSEMLYLGGDVWVRKELIKTALGDPVPEPGKPRDPNAPRVNNGITGDARRVERGAGQAGVRHEGRLRRQADPEFRYHALSLAAASARTLAASWPGSITLAADVRYGLRALRARRVRDGGGPLVGVRHRGEHGDLHADQRRDAADAPREPAR